MKTEEDKIQKLVNMHTKRELARFYLEERQNTKEETEDEKKFDLLIRIILYFIIFICSFTLIIVVYQFLQLLEVIK